MSKAYWINTSWMLSCAQEAGAFHRATRDVRRTQEQVLLRILRENQDSWYGRHFDFARIRTAQQYQQQVPLTNYDRLHEAIDRIASGERQVLTRQPVLLLEPTGGSSGGEKLVPYTAALRQEFQRAVAAWVYDVLRQVPAARRGRAYWSISPIAQRRRQTSGGIAIGFEDDRDYLGRWQRWALSHLLAVPAWVARLRSLENARYVTLLYLLAASDLALISIWSPTFLTALLEHACGHWEAICSDLSDGCVRLPRPGEQSGAASFPLPRNRKRADELRRIFRDAGELPATFAACWPRLAMVSCWADASSALFVPRLQSLVPQAVLQPKGLLATEGVVSIPLLASRGSVLAVRSHFLEFADADAEQGHLSGCTRLADELELHRQYRVVLTTGGGLYRYDLGDIVRVTDFYHQCPVIQFLGRSDIISDLVGEKLDERHVRAAIDNACRLMGLAARFALVAPKVTRPAGYCLYVECSDRPSETQRRRLATALQEQLEANPQYRIAVATGQLLPIDVRFVESGAWNLYQQVGLERHQKLGDIKAKSLDTWCGWDKVFVESD